MAGVCAALLAVCWPGPAWGQVRLVPSRSAPSASYFSIFHAYFDGDYRDALKDFRSEGRGAIKNGPGNHWIDSICYHTMTGECFYELGQLPQALEHYNAALELFAAYANWMQRVNFDPALRPANAGQVKRVPWGQTRRQARVAQFPDTTLISQGRINTNDQVRRGGVVEPPVLYSINVQEIVRCTSLALRRRRELLGPCAPHDPLSNKLIAVLAQRPGPPNHWSEAWIDVQLGLAYSAAGKDAQARTALERAVLAAGQFDHPLTATALLELGRLAFTAEDYAAAEEYFLEATYAAVNFGDAGVLEEAFRSGLQTHIVANRQGLYPPLAAAIPWARAERLRHLQASLSVLLAENYCILNQPQAASAALADARGAMGRSDMPDARLGARMNYTAALASYQQGNAADGDATLNAAFGFQRTGSLWLFHMGLADGLWRERGISDRLAMELYSVVLRDPTLADWATDPLESLSSLVSPHAALFERWFEVALARNEHEAALAIADLSRRHRFLSTLEMGGRLESLRWVLEGPPEMLDQQATLQRQDLLVRYPQYDQHAQRMRQLEEQLDQAPKAPENADAASRLSSLLGEVATVSQAQERLLRQIALSRSPCDIVFPPKRTMQQVQKSLGEGQAMLVFFSTSRNLYAFLMTRDKYAHWPVPAARSLPKQVQALLRGWGNYEQNKVLELDELTDPGWRVGAKQILTSLIEDSNANLPQVCQELVIVPDGLLWYLPFEALQVADGEQTVPLISKIRIRYAPTASLGVADPRPRRRSGSTGVVLGRLFPRDDAQVTERAFESLSRSVSGSVALRGPLPAPPSIYATLFDRLIVYSDIEPPESGAYDWSPIQVGRAAHPGELAHWFALPWGGPEQIILPGFHTAAERSLKGQSLEMAGNDLFLSLCGLMSTGARTILISRWRTGGATSFDLVREFAQELPHTTAADAWQRSVLLIRDAPLDPAMEPRLKVHDTQRPLLADHPFFWAGYLLADTGSSPHVDDPDPAGNVLVRQANGNREQDPAADGDRRDSDAEAAAVIDGEPAPPDEGQPAGPAQDLGGPGASPPPAAAAGRKPRKGRRP